MEELKKMNKDGFWAQMQGECHRIMDEISEAVNAAPTGNVISGSEMPVRDRMGELRQKAFELAVQMRVDSTESTFSPSEGCGGGASGEQGTHQPQSADGQRSDQLLSATVGRRGGGKRVSGGQTGR